VDNTATRNPDCMVPYEIYVLQLKMLNVSATPKWKTVITSEQRERGNLLTDID
jgi:hypothetical protein